MVALQELRDQIGEAMQGIYAGFSPREIDQARRHIVGNITDTERFIFYFNAISPPSNISNRRLRDRLGSDIKEKLIIPGSSDSLMRENATIILEKAGFICRLPQTKTQ